MRNHYVFKALQAPCDSFKNHIHSRCYFFHLSLSLCLYLYVHTYSYIYIYVSIYIYIYTYIHIIYVYMYIHIDFSIKAPILVRENELAVQNSGPTLNPKSQALL